MECMRRIKERNGKVAKTPQCLSTRVLVWTGIKISVE